jgi:glutamate synthase (NADPH/NADH) small chain
VAFLSTIPGLALDRAGRVVVDADGATGNPKVFAGGDCVSGGKEVVNAVAEGKRAALAIDARFGKGN